MRFHHIRHIMAATLIATATVCTHGAEIIPLPVSFDTGVSAYKFPANATYSLPDSPGGSIAKAFATLQPELEKQGGFKLTPSNGNADIKLVTDTALGNEAYTIDVTPQGVEIKASHPAGFFYALQTLRQLLPADAQSAPASLTEVHIADEPRFGWRGFMLDEGRHMFGKDEVKKVLDMMAMYKLNRFHWHLTEDQGWRIEIPKYPKLTEIGANRSSRLLGWKEAEPDTVAYGGFYTGSDISDIVAYAKERFIEVVPEIDMPGHTQAAVAAYPELLACDPENGHEVWTRMGVSNDVMNVANPASVQMAKDIIDELIPLFPFGYIHLGGDECPTDKWETNADCRALLDSLKSTNYRDLQLDFYSKLAAHIAAKPADQQRKLIFWNEVLHGNTDMLPKDMTIMAWIGTEEANEAAKEAATRGFTTILTPQIPYYINRKQSSQPDEPLSQGPGTETLEAVYAYVPMQDVPDDIADKYMGVQANFWSEFVDTPDFLEYLMMPRLAAVAEAAWTPQNKREYTDFLQRIRAHESIYKAHGWNYAPHVFSK